jgi:acyl-CoA reductase-like NAD-dependent aldehyde dehydrogenase
MSGLTNETAALKIAKTIKLFIGGDFPRTESGRSMPVYQAKSKKLYANLCKASRKDLRNAVTAAQGAQHGWAAKTAYNRTQILYRMAEMTEGKREEFIEVLTKTLGYTKIQANKSVNEAIDAFVYYAGFADKYQQVIGAVNPVSGPHHNFTTSEPMGVVALVGNSKFNLGDLVSQIAAIIASGNALVVIMATEGAATIAPLSEVFATSDLSKGVVNLLTGDLQELYPHLGSHMEVNSISFQSNDKKILGELKEMGATNMKRVIGPVTANDQLSLTHLISFVEYKTVWHPIGN